MTAQLEALDALIAAIEAGDDGTLTTVNRRIGSAAHDVGGLWHGHDIAKAFSGSLDAAHRLHDALLPGWIMWSDTTGFAQIYKDEMEVTASHTALVPGKRARAELIAILHAYRTTLETKP